MCVNFIFISGRDYDITTVYKYPQAEPFTCNVSIHFHTNAKGLPFMRQRDVNNIIYTTAFPTIPSLDSEQMENTTWEMVNQDNTLYPVKSTALSGDYEYLNPFKSTKDIFVDPAVNAIYLSEKNVTTSETVFTEAEFQNENYPNLLYIKFKRIEPFLNVLLHPVENSDFESIKLSMNQDTVGVCVVYGLLEDKNDCNYVPYVYGTDDENEAHLYLNLVGQMNLYDAVNFKVLPVLEEIGDLTLTLASISLRIQGNNVNATSRDPVTLTLMQRNIIVLSEDSVLVSPLTNAYINNTSLFVSFYRKLNNDLRVYLLENGTDRSLELSSQIQSATKIVSDVGNNDVDEMVIMKFDVTYPQNWTEEKQLKVRAEKHVYIRNIWEGAML